VKAVQGLSDWESCRYQKLRILVRTWLHLQQQESASDDVIGGHESEAAPRQAFVQNLLLGLSSQRCYWTMVHVEGGESLAALMAKRWAPQVLIWGG
jgi:hypothetical protein